MSLKIVQEDDGKKGRFILESDGDFAGEMTYTWAGDEKFIIDHTAVEEGHEGKGFGKKLLDAAIDYARENNLKILPLCPFAKKMMDRDDSLEDIRF